MSKPGNKIKNEHAREICKEFMNLIHDQGMAKISVLAGSTRRGKPMVNDIEILVFPIIIPPAPQQDLLISSPDQSPKLTKPKNKFNALWENFLYGYKDIYIRGSLNGPLHKDLHHKRSGVKLDIYMVEDLRAWGVQNVIRTGPKAFNIAIMKHVNSLVSAMHVKDGFLHGHEKDLATSSGEKGLNYYKVSCDLGAECPELIPCPTEDDFFHAIGLNFVQPWARDGSISKHINPERVKPSILPGSSHPKE